MMDNPKRYTKIDCLLNARRIQVRTLKKRIAALIAEKEQRDKQIERQAKAILKEIHG